MRKCYNACENHWKTSGEKERAIQLNILVVDDEKEIADLIELYLKMKTIMYLSFIRLKRLWHVLSMRK